MVKWKLFVYYSVVYFSTYCRLYNFVLEHGFSFLIAVHMIMKEIKSTSVRIADIPAVKVT
jgi:hypothetical protein